MKTISNDAASDNLTSEELKSDDSASAEPKLEELNPDDSAED